MMAYVFYYLFKEYIKKKDIIYLNSDFVQLILFIFITIK